jgi:3-oxoacyl-(acyl-carrier-protein) synthase
LVKYGVVIADASVLTPLDSAEGDTWGAMRAGKMVTDRGMLSDALLTGTDVELDRSTRLALACVGRVGGVLREMPLFVGTSKGPILSWLAAAEAVRGGRGVSRRLAEQVARGPHALAMDLAERLELRGTLYTSVAACSSGLHALHRAVRAIEWGECERALVLAADASHHPLLEGSFERLGVLSPADPDGRRRCRPFDPAGKGFVVSEAAVAVVLERAEAGQAGIEIAASHFGAVGGDMVAIDPKGESLRAGIGAVLRGAAVAFVHAHATGTAHDAVELRAIRAVCGEVPVISSKQWLGHSLGAAGLLSLALSWRAHIEGELWTGVRVPAGARSLTISQGFGGHIAAVVLRDGRAAT